MKEQEIRPKELFKHYLSLAEHDSINFFAKSNVQQFSCPGCFAKGNFEFSKNGFSYRFCDECQTLFVAPRPSDIDFQKFYEEGQSTAYWATDFYSATSEARKEKLWKPKVKQLSNWLSLKGINDCSVVDIGGGYGVFADCWSEVGFSEVIVIEPSATLAAICREKGHFVVQKFFESVSAGEVKTDEGKPTVFTSFELIEHLPNPNKFLEHLSSLMVEGDMFVFSTLSCTGLDIQLLWDKSDAVHPPHHINFFSPTSIALACSRAGLQVLEVLTPGFLDIDIISNKGSDISDRFWRTFLSNSNEVQKGNMQKAISENGYSSHMWVFCRKGQRL